MPRAVCLILTLLALITNSMADDKQLHQREDSSFVEKALAEAKETPGEECLPLFFARKLIGRPYVGRTLEVNQEEQLVVNTRQLDCTTLVENVMALTLCAQRGQQTFAHFEAMLTLIRYRGGKLRGYPSRLHYFSDWIDDNESLGLVGEISSPNPPFSATQRLHINYMSQHPDLYRALRERPELVATIRKQEEKLTGQTHKYIPKAAVGNSDILRKAIADGDIIAITTSKAGLDIAHLGFAVWRDDGLHLLNASMIHKKVVEEPMTLGQYLAKHPSFTGIRVIRINKQETT